jgi:uncharacterized protein YyaL (SSP411 family)
MHTNRLIEEKSPYLLQHAHNPVDWYPWGKEAFEKARSEDKPIFLSIGYSTCYWCHVMEREVFEIEETARLMNEHLVCIKVDREERPDVDRVYMTAVQAMTGSGGWPMSMFLTPDLKPFFGGTYFPPEDAHGRPGFPNLVRRIAELWKTRRSDLANSSEDIFQHLQSLSVTKPTDENISEEILHEGFRRFEKMFDPLNGGFGGAPKFPRPSSLNFLIRYHARTGNQTARKITLDTLDAMAAGGINDHLGGGFHRYATDGEWRIPHFEKMLYDQAQLACAYLDAYQLTRERRYADVAVSILEYVRRVLEHHEGGYFAAEDAESATDPSEPAHKHEGAFYLWKRTELGSLLSAEAASIFEQHYGVAASGNVKSDPHHVFTGQNILYQPHDSGSSPARAGVPQPAYEFQLEESRRVLFAAREKRPHPHLDDKILTAWNGLMIGAFARAAQVLNEPSYADSAVRAARFVMKELIEPATGKLLRRFRDGDARFSGTLQDYAFFVQGLLDLFETGFDADFLETAIALTKKQTELFWDESNGGFFDASNDAGDLLMLTKEQYDGAEPAGNSVAALNLLRLGDITGEKQYHDRAARTVRSFLSSLNTHPDTAPQMLVAVDWMLSSSKEIVIVRKPEPLGAASLLHEIHAHFLPRKVLLSFEEGAQQTRLARLSPFVAKLTSIDGKPTAYVCENFVCNLPVTGRDALEELLVSSVVSAR